MAKQFIRSVLVSLVFLVLLGVGYPLLETGVAQLVFPYQANGSLTSYGSMEVGQQWGGTKFFHGRLDPYTPLATGGSNYGPTSKVLQQQTKKAIEMWHRLGVRPTEELVTNSGSGVDPDVSVQSALVQIPMVSKARGIPATTLRNLIRKYTVSKQFGFLGESYVNVLQLNVALSKLK